MDRIADKEDAMRTREQGQAAMECLIVTVLLVGLTGAGMFGEGGGLLGWLLEALRGFHGRFAATLALPL
jgi:hypothetical protein